MPKPKNIVLVDEINENWGRETRHAYHAAREIQDQGDTPTTRKVAKKIGMRIETVGEKLRKIKGVPIDESRRGRKGKKREEGFKVPQDIFNTNAKNFAKDILSGNISDSELRARAEKILKTLAGHVDDTDSRISVEKDREINK